jgi:hypothetical protein
MSRAIEFIRKIFKPKPLQTQENYIQEYFREYGNLKCPECGHAVMKEWHGTGTIMSGFFLNDASCLGCGTVVGPEWASDAVCVDGTWTKCNLNNFPEKG